jgi:hypothetical protein
VIISNDETALLRLWREKRGEAEPPDYSDNLIVQLGAATELLNRRWYERKHPELGSPSVIRWMAATLDGIVEGSGAVFEAKFMLPWSFSEEAAAEKHMAQVQHNMGLPMQRTRCSRSFATWALPFKRQYSSKSNGPAIRHSSANAYTAAGDLRRIWF